MNAPAALPAPLDAPLADPDEERARVLLERQRGRLDRLAEAGMEMIEALVAQAKGSGPVVAEGDIALAFSRVSRAVRMAVLLQARLAERPAPEEAAAPTAIVYSWAEPPDARAERALARRERIEQIVEDVADREREDPEAADRLGREAAERLERDSVYGDVLERPVSELVADICRDLGLDPDWDGLIARPWARREIDSGEVGAPLAAAMARRRRAPPPDAEPPPEAWPPRAGSNAVPP